MTGTLTRGAVLLFLIVFLWTPPHFWALALYTQSDYRAAGVPMMPNVVGDAVDQAADPCLFGAAGRLGPAADRARLCRLGLYRRRRRRPGVGFLLSGLARCWRTREDVADARSRRAALFNYSLSYLFIVFFALPDRQPAVAASELFGCMSAPDEIRAVELEAPEAAAARAKRPSPPLDRPGHRAGAVRHHLLRADHRQDGPGRVRSGAVMA